MSLLLLDFARRWKSWAVGVALIIILTSLGLVGERSSGFYVIRAALFAFGFIAIAVDSSLPRMMLSLPISRRDLATTAWLIAVPINVAFVTLCSAIGAVVWLPTGEVPADAWELILMSGVVGFGLTGAAWFWHSQFIRDAGPGPVAKAWYLACYFGVPVLCLLLLRMPLRVSELAPENFGLLGLMLALTVVGFLRRDGLVAARVVWSRRLAILSSGGGGSTAIGRHDSSGMTWMIRRMSLSTLTAFLGLCFLLVLLLAVDAVFTLPAGLDPMSLLQLQGDSAFPFPGGYNPVALFFWMGPVLSALAPMFQLRLLRTLPLRSGQIAAWVVGSPIVCCVSVWLGVGLVGFLILGETNPASLALHACIVMIAVTVPIPMSLRWGIGVGSSAGMFGVVMMIVALPGALEAHLSLEIVALATATAIAGSWFLSHRLLSRSSAPYRGQIIRFPGMPTGS